MADQSNTARGWTKGEPIQYLRGHAPKRNQHVLSSLDERNRRADCSVCGEVTVKRNGSVGWTCTRKINDEHRLGEVDLEEKTAYCRECRVTVEIFVRGGRPFCAVKARVLDLAYRTKVGREAMREQHRAWRTANRDHLRNYAYLKAYGLTLEQVEEMLVEQHGLCYICHQPPKATDRGGILHLDHSHVSGKVGRLLCWDCNKGLGAFGDDPERLRAAAEYLLDHR